MYHIRVFPLLHKVGRSGIFFYCFIVKCKINSAKSLTPIGIEPATLGLWHLLCLHSHALTTELSYQVLIEGYFTSLVLVQLTFGCR